MYAAHLSLERDLRVLTSSFFFALAAIYLVFVTVCCTVILRYIAQKKLLNTNVSFVRIKHIVFQYILIRKRIIVLLKVKYNGWKKSSSGFNIRYI
jgi:ABC-type siderophore export system fused ATPase/permease subunit